jgi:hypothetical protein
MTDGTQVVNVKVDGGTTVSLPFVHSLYCSFSLLISCDQCFECLEGDLTGHIYLYFGSCHVLFIHNMDMKYEPPKYPRNKPFRK